MSFATDLDVAGRRVLVCGAGVHALAPVRALLDAHAVVTVAGADPVATIADLGSRGLIAIAARTVRAADLERCDLVVPATGDPVGDAEVRRLAARAGRLATAPSAAERRAAGAAGTVVLVGGGPGDPGLLTVAGLEAVRTADVVVCDRLAPLGVLQQARPDAEIVDVAKIPRGAYLPQETINQILVDRARAGKAVVRLKGGDSFVFGRGGEEWLACAAAGVPVTVIPGLTSAVAGPALAGVPLTHRDLTQGFTVVSGHLPPGDPGSTLDWAAIARANTTLVIMMGLATLGAITAELITQGMQPGTPSLTVADAGLSSQRAVRGTLADIAELSRDAGLKPPAITVIGAVAAFPAQVRVADSEA